MNHIWSVLCEKSVIDSETNNISLLNVVEKLTLTVDQKAYDAFRNSEQELRLPYSLELISLWSKEESVKKESGEILIEVHGPQKKNSEFKHPIEITERYSRIRTRIKIETMNIKVSGLYKFIVKIKDKQAFKKVAEIPLELVVKPTAEKN